MDEITLLGRLRSEVPLLPVDRLGPAQARLDAELRRRAGAGPSAVRRWHPHRFVPVAVLAAVTLLLVATDVLVAGAGSDGRGTGFDRSGAVAVSAADVLERAAARLEQTAPTSTLEPVPRPDQYVIVQTWADATRVVNGADGKGAMFVEVSRVQHWLPANGIGVEATSTEIFKPKAYQGLPIPAEARNRVGTIVWTKCDVRPTGKTPVDYQYLATLPSDPAGMLRYLRGLPGGASDLAVWSTATGLLRDAYVPWPQRVALLRALKSVTPTSVSDGVDDNRYQGIAVGLTDPATGIRHEVVFDRQWYALLGTREVVVSALGKAGTARLPVGAAVYVTRRAAVILVDRPPVVPLETATNC